MTSRKSSPVELVETQSTPGRPSNDRFAGLRHLMPQWSAKLGVGLVMVVLIVLFGLIGPMVTVDPRDSSYKGLQPPSSEHWLGTTKLGYDVLAQLATGTRESLYVGLVGGLVAMGLAIAFGILAGYFGGWLDEGLMLATNIMLVIPGLPLVMVIAAYVQNTEGLGEFARSSTLVALILGVTGWAGSAVVLRAQARSLRTREYVAAARVAGENGLRIIFVEILPNLVPLIAAQAVQHQLHHVTLPVQRWRGVGKHKQLHEYFNTFTKVVNADDVLNGAAKFAQLRHQEKSFLERTGGIATLPERPP